MVSLTFTDDPSKVMTISSLATIMRSSRLGSASEATAAPPMLAAMVQAIAAAPIRNARLPLPHAASLPHGHPAHGSTARKAMLLINDDASSRTGADERSGRADRQTHGCSRPGRRSARPRLEAVTAGLVVSRDHWLRCARPAHRVGREKLRERRCRQRHGERLPGGIRRGGRLPGRHSRPAVPRGPASRHPHRAHRATGDGVVHAADAAVVRWRCGFLFVLCAMPTTGSVKARAVRTVISEETLRDEATILAKLIYPEALNRAITTYTIVQVVTPAYHADQGLQSLEADYPGIIDAMIAAMQPEFEQGRVDALPTLWAKTAAVYASNLSLDELQQTIAFYASPAGQRLSAAKRDAIANASSPRPERRAGPDPDAGSKPDEVQLSRTFASTATGRKLAALQPQIDAIIAAWSEAPTPEADARVTAALSKVVTRYSRSAPRSVDPRPTMPPQHSVVKPTE
ncbi:MAG: DUF2059 domain-containing protein [Sphingomonas sp.]|nr:MAG: DUF2059 domain-containing protein [Sphingomonas sp.]